MPAGSSFSLVGAAGRTTLPVEPGGALQGVSPLVCFLGGGRHRRPLVWQASRRGGRLCLSPHQQHRPPLTSHPHWELPGCSPPSPPVSISCSVSLTGAVASSVGPPEGWPHSRTPHRSSRSSQWSPQRSRRGDPEPWEVAEVALGPGAPPTERYAAGWNGVPSSVSPAVS